jgi:glutathione S-transferase
LHPTPPLFGRSPYEIAEVEMWIRRAEFRLWTPMGQVWINDDPRTAVVNPNQFKDYGAHMRKAVAHAMKWIDKELSGAGPYLVHDYFSMADIVLLCGIDFAGFVKMPIPDECTHLKAWHDRVSARPSARAPGVKVAA